MTDYQKGVIRRRLNSGAAKMIPRGVVNEIQPNQKFPHNEAPFLQ